MNELAGLLVVSLAMTVVPGIDTAMVLRMTLKGGRADGLKTAAGCATGLFVHAAAVAVGLAALIAASATAYHVLRIAGAVFLVVIGVLAIVRPGRRAETTRLLGTTPFLTGLLTNLGNPKALLFFLSVLPQFLPASTVAALPTALALATIPVICSFAGLSVWAIVSGRLRAQLQTPRARRIQERIMGSVLVALGIRVAAER
ncbi:MAG TPA: LysE family translocator [Solirubrobacteraceae bacterium]|nr:LysE family translocator [Solirubrobacteraceae bacterium]